MQWRALPVHELRRVNFYAHDWHSTSRLEMARASGLEMVLTLQTAVDDLEHKLQIDRR